MISSRLSMTFILALCLTASSLSAAELTSHQRSQLLREATTLYEQGLQSAGADVAAAKDAFATAAEKYRLLVGSGIENPHLYANLGNAELQCGRLGEAVAAYEHAAVLAPHDLSIRRHLDNARSMVAGGSPVASGVGTVDHLAGWNQSVPISVRLSVGLLAWTLLWAGLLGWMISRSAHWRKTAIGSGVVAVLMATSISWDWSRRPHAEFGIITAATIVRMHNGDTFTPVVEQPLSEGTRFDVVDRRGDWLRIRLSNGVDGWIPMTAADVIVPAPLLGDSLATPSQFRTAS